MDKAAENQQIANDLSQATRLIQEGRLKETIDLLQPLYTGQSLPASIRDEIRELLASAYLQHGVSLMREAENATSQRGIRESLVPAHLSLTIADFLHSEESVKKHIAMLEQTLPDLVDQRYDPSLFPQAPGARRHTVARSRFYRYIKKMKIRMKGGMDIFPKILSAPHFIPVTLIPLVGISLLLASLLGGGIVSALLLALFLQLALSFYFIAAIKSDKKKILFFLSAFACFLFLADMAWMALYKGKIPELGELLQFRGRPSQTPGPRKPIGPKPQKPIQKPLQTPVPIKTPVPGIPKGPGFFAPVWNLSEKIFEEKKPVSIASAVTPVEQTKTEPTATPSKTPEPAPSMIGHSVELSFIIQEFIGLRQKPTPAFMYQITTQKGLGTLLLDPLVYIKISKDKLEQKGWQKAKVKIITEGDINVYSIESPSDLSP